MHILVLVNDFILPHRLRPTPLPPDRPKSLYSKQNLQGTCRSKYPPHAQGQCHARRNPKEPVLFNQLGIKSSRGFGSSSPFGVGEINMIESKFFAESPWPFKVVHKRPCCVPSDVTAVEYDSYTKYVLYEI